MESVDKYLDKFGSNFLVASMIPSLGLVIACMVAFDPILNVSSAFQRDNGINSLLGISLLVTVPTVIVGYTLTALNTFILKFFEGYVFFHRFRFMRRAYARHANRLIEERERLRSDIDALMSKRRLSKADRVALDQLETDYYSLVTNYDQLYPPPHAGIMPTKFGNILKASEAYAGTRYGIDAVQFWPRLWHVIPTSYQQTIENARNELSFLVNMSTLSVVFFALCILAILISTPSPGSIIWDTFLANSVRYVLAASLAMLWNRFFNKAALLSVGEYGMIVRSAYDLFRLDLLDQFHIKQPRNSAEEFRIWKNLGQLIGLGQEAINFSTLRYQSKKQE